MLESSVWIAALAIGTWARVLEKRSEMLKSGFASS
jgi:hypothetical protein